MTHKGPNHPFVVWASCFLWIISMFAIAWSLILLFCIGDMLLTTAVDIVIAFLLLSGILMLPTNVHILYYIANNKKIDHKSKVVCCPLWLCIIWIIIINAVAAILCIQRIRTCGDITAKHISNCIKHYRSVPRYKHFIDNLQWSLKCCGLDSYKDWFKHDWYDKIRDYEWDPNTNKHNIRKNTGREKPVMDSVPLRLRYYLIRFFNRLQKKGDCQFDNCCKSGSCIYNYLSELGTYSINTVGCGETMQKFIMISMALHLCVFLLIIVTEILILKFIIRNDGDAKDNNFQSNKYNVRHIMSVNDNFDVSSASCQYNPEESDDDDEHSSRRIQVENVKKDIYKSAGFANPNEEYSGGSKKNSN